MVSVILIFHNEAAYLEEAICSVRNQTYEHWELLLIDDGSTDESPQLARTAMAQDQKRIRCLAHAGHANRGMSASRNLGLAEARGEYIAFLDGDDVFLPKRLEQHVAILQHFPCVAMVQSDHIRWRSYANLDGRSFKDPVRPFRSVGDQLLWPPQALKLILVIPYLSAGICNITVRRTIAQRIGGFVDAFSCLYEDQAFFARVSLSHPVYFLQAYLACYRHHPASAIRRIADAGISGQQALDTYSRAYFNWLIDLLENNPGPDTSELLEIARSRLSALTPTAQRRVKNILAGTAKTLMSTALPLSWFASLQELARAYQAWLSSRAYAALARDLTTQARAQACPPENKS